MSAHCHAAVLQLVVSSLAMSLAAVWQTYMQLCDNVVVHIQQHYRLSDKQKHSKELLVLFLITVMRSILSRVF